MGMRRVWPLIIAFAALLFGCGDAAFAAGPNDPHQIYEERCRNCHFEHGADLARQKLRVVSGVLQVARTGKPTNRLLQDHHGVKLTAAEIAVLTELFTSGLKWGGVFQHRCARCHQSAANFARTRLMMADGRIVTRTDNVDVAGYLLTHGEATPAEIETLIEMLKFQIRTAPGN